MARGPGLTFWIGFAWTHPSYIFFSSRNFHWCVKSVVHLGLETCVSSARQTVAHWLILSRFFFWTGDGLFLHWRPNFPQFRSNNRSPRPRTPYKPGSSKLYWNNKIREREKQKRLNFFSDFIVQNLAHSSYNFLGSWCCCNMRKVTATW